MLFLSNYIKYVYNFSYICCYELFVYLYFSKSVINILSIYEFEGQRKSIFFDIFRTVQDFGKCNFTVGECMCMLHVLDYSHCGKNIGDVPAEITGLTPLDFFGLFTNL